MLSRKVLYNMIGWQTKRHFVVIESDDWGSIRTPSRDVYDEFLRRGIRVDKDPYCHYDGLATKHDFENLFEVLQSVKDSNGHSAIITANTLSANPIFEKIKESEFTQYFFEPFTETLKHDAAHDDAWAMWKEGIAANIFHPQCHGREHLYVKKWLLALQSGNSITRTAFDLGTWGLTEHVDSSIKEYYMGAFNSSKPEDIAEFEKIVDDALYLFEQIFGAKSESFIAPTYEWSPQIEPCLVRNGVKYIQGALIQKIPIGDDEGVRLRYNGFLGTRSRAGLVHLFRNCFFEPSIKPNYDYLDDCLKRIEIAFKWKKAAIICAHRVNFIGSIDSSNTDRNLPMFKHLLNEIINRWPDVEFVSSDELGKIITQS